jgi:hypothetical protein
VTCGQTPVLDPSEAGGLLVGPGQRGGGGGGLEEVSL